MKSKVKRPDAKRPEPPTQEVIDDLAVLNALRAAFPPRVIHDL